MNKAFLPRAAAALAYLFWGLLLCAALYSSLRYGGFHPDQYYLIGIPVGMILLTALFGRHAGRSRNRWAFILTGSVLAVFAALIWAGVWGADV